MCDAIRCIELSLIGSVMPCCTNGVAITKRQPSHLRNSTERDRERWRETERDGASEIERQSGRDGERQKEWDRETETGSTSKETTRGKTWTAHVRSLHDTIH